MYIFSYITNDNVSKLQVSLLRLLIHIDVVYLKFKQFKQL